MLHGGCTCALRSADNKHILGVPGRSDGSQQPKGAWHKGCRTGIHVLKLKDGALAGTGLFTRYYRWLMLSVFVSFTQRPACIVYLLPWMVSVFPWCDDNHCVINIRQNMGVYLGPRHFPVRTTIICSCIYR